MIKVEADRLGKLALLLAMSSRDEEDKIKEIVAKEHQKINVGVTFLSGSVSTVMNNITRAAIGCSIQNKIIKGSPQEVHAIVHAALEAITGITNHVTIDASLKIKMSIVTDGLWVIVAVYGDSAIHPITNHERAGMGVMHI